MDAFVNRNLKIILFLSIISCSCYNIHSDPEGFSHNGAFYFNDGSVGFGKRTDGKWEGEVLIRNASRQPVSRGEFKNGVRNGFWENRNTNGTFASKGFYTDGLRSGEWEFFYSNGNPMSRGTFEKDNRTGKWTFWYSEGSLQEIRLYENGLNKLTESWFEDGRQMVIAGSGTYFYFSNGKIMEQGAYLDSLMTGEWIFLNEDGSVKRRDTYLAGKKL